MLQKFDIDPRQFKTLFAVYFKQDFRSGKAAFQQSRKEYVTANSAIWSLLGVYFFSGAIVSTTALLANVLVFSVLTLAYTFFFVALTIIAESGNVIFNDSEPEIIGHLPIRSRTLFAAKVANLFAFTALLALAMNLCPMISGIWAAGANAFFPVAHLVGALGAALFATAMVITGYGLLMRFVDKERFNNIVAYAQAALTIGFILGFQLLPRWMERVEASGQQSEPRFFLFFPPAWFSGITMLLLGRLDAYTLTLAGLALLALALLGWLALRKVSLGYASFVSRLTFDGGDARPRGKAEKRRRSPFAALTGKLKAVFLRQPVERAVFELVAIYLRRDREVKVRLYPNFAYILMFPFIGLLSIGLPDPFLDKRAIFQTLSGAAMIPFIAMSAVETILFSEHYHAAYLFRVAPVESIGAIHNGLRKAILCFVALPGAFALALFYALVWGNLWHALVIILPWLLLTPVMMLLPFLRRERLPLSRKYQKGQQSARAIFLMLGVFVVFFFIGTLQAISLAIPQLVLAFPALVLLLAPLAYLILRALSGEAMPVRSLSED